MIKLASKTSLVGSIAALAALGSLAAWASHRKVKWSVEELAVRITASPAPAGAGIVLRWNEGPRDTRAIDVYRRSSPGAAFGPPIAAGLPPSTVSYTDSAASRGVVYEYYVERQHPRNPWRTGAAISAAIEAPLVEDRGRIALVIEDGAAAALAPEIDRLEDDLLGDGWSVARVGVSEGSDPPSVKAKIKAVYDAAPGEVKAALLLGHVPVPYAGNAAPDGHVGSARGGSVHLGAWAADIYYADMVGVWTDSAVDTRNNAFPPDEARNANIPGDGKFDQQWAGVVTPLLSQSKWPWTSNQNMPGDGGPDPVRGDAVDGGRYPFGPLWLAPAPRAPIAIAVGRVDLSDMPAFAPLTEVDLLRRYLDKDHRYRLGILKAAPSGLVRARIGHGPFEKDWGPGLLPASGAVSAFTALLGPSSVRTGAWFDAARETSVFAFAACPGQQTSCADTCTTADLAAADPRVIFTVLYGSHFGDWDHRDNLMRAVLAAPGSGLTAGWGDPSWFLDSMAVGGTIGDALLRTQRAVPLIHLALMGDPTLRLHVVAPPSAVEVAVLPGGNRLTWRASPDRVDGYHVYRAMDRRGPFQRISSSPLHVTDFIDPSRATGAIYLVRALRLERTPSGSYLNASQGASSGAPARVSD